MNRREHTEPEDRLRTSRGAALWAAAQAGLWIARAGDRWVPDLAPARWAATRLDRLGQWAVAAEEWVRDLLRDRWAVAPAEPQGVRARSRARIGRFVSAVLGAVAQHAKRAPARDGGHLVPSIESTPAIIAHAAATVGAPIHGRFSGSEGENLNEQFTVENA